MGYMHIRENYIAFKKEEILSQVTTWMKQEDIILSEIFQSQKDKYSFIPLIF